MIFSTRRVRWVLMASCVLMRDSSFANWFGSSSFSTWAPRSSLTVVSRMTAILSTVQNLEQTFLFPFEMVCLTTWRRDANSSCERPRSFRFNRRFSWNTGIPPSSKDFMHSLAETEPLRQATQINIYLFMAIRSFFAKNSLKTESRHSNKGLNKSARTAADISAVLRLFSKSYPRSLAKCASRRCRQQREE